MKYFNHSNFNPELLEKYETIVAFGAYWTILNVVKIDNIFHITMEDSNNRVRTVTKKR